MEMLEIIKKPILTTTEFVISLTCSVYDAWVLTLMWPWFFPGTLSLPKAYGFFVVVFAASIPIMSWFVKKDEVKSFDNIMIDSMGRSLTNSLTLTFTLPLAWVAHKVVWWVG